MKKAAEAWLDFAHRDLEAAKLLVDHEYVSNAVLFHSQQCVEKCLKALLEEADVPVPHLHDAVYIDTRYPSGIGLLPSGFPTKEDAQGLLKIAEKVYRETATRLSG
ncbi:MAG: HEPN domain-containing protein [Thermodesulfobacteriota bacterium]